MAYLLSALRSHLVAENIVRVPAVSGVKPPMWLEPRNGAPAPGEGDSPTEIGHDAVLSAFVTGGIPARPREVELRKDVVDIWIRVAAANLAFDIEEQLRAAIVDRVDWTMGGLHIGESLQWRSPLQRLESGPQGWTFVSSYIFERRAF
jgi:hypothetical protein